MLQIRLGNTWWSLFCGVAIILRDNKTEQGQKLGTLITKSFSLDIIVAILIVGSFESYWYWYHTGLNNTDTDRAYLYGYNISISVNVLESVQRYKKNDFMKSYGEKKNGYWWPFFINFCWKASKSKNWFFCIDTSIRPRQV